jgi:hypothetical protein
MRKSIQRQVESGNITGGYSSHASRIAKVLCEQFKLSYIRGDYWGLHVQFTNEKSREEACAVMRADFAAYLLTTDDNDKHGWLQRSKNTLQENIKILASGESAHLRFYGGKEYVQMMRDLFVNSRNPSDVFNAKQVSNMLNQETPITVHNYNWKD